MRIGVVKTLYRSPVRNFFCSTTNPARSLFRLRQNSRCLWHLTSNRVKTDTYNGFPDHNCINHDSGCAGYNQVTVVNGVDEMLHEIARDIGRVFIRLNVLHSLNPFEGTIEFRMGAEKDLGRLPNRPRFNQFLKYVGYPALIRKKEIPHGAVKNQFF